MTELGILAATITIALEGLMLLHGDASMARTAVLVNTSDELDRTSTIEIWRRPFRDCPSEVEPIENKDVIRFENLPRTPVLTDALYKKHVPHLASYVFKGKIDSEKFTEKAGVLARVELPAGSMTTFDTFAERVELIRDGPLFFNPTNLVCFARFVVLDQALLPASPEKPAYLIIKRGSDEIQHVLKDGDLVVISNTAKTKERTDPGDSHKPHFLQYKRLLTEDGTIRQSVVLHKPPACVSEASQETDPAVKIVLMKYRLKPGRAPHGDCGPTGNP